MAQRGRSGTTNKGNSERVMNAFGGGKIEGGRIGAAKGAGIIVQKSGNPKQPQQQQQQQQQKFHHGQRNDGATKDPRHPALGARADGGIVKKKKKAQPKIDPAEARAIAAREAARARVQARTLGSLGMK